MSQKHEVLYFDKQGKANMTEALEWCMRVAKKDKIEYMVMATTKGDTPLMALKLKKKLKYKGQIIAVGYHYGFFGPNKQPMTPQTRAKIQKLGGIVFHGSHGLSGISRSFRTKFGGISIPEIIAETLRRFSQGVKVAVEVSLMAADAGLIPVEQDIISMGGMGRGADSGLILQPCNQNTFLSLNIKRLLCMPMN